MSAEPPTLHSRRSLDLRFNIPISKTHQFWDSLREGKFVTTKCEDCGQLSFPPQTDCPRCMSGNSEWVELPTQATLVTFTYVQVTPTSFVQNDPYIVAIGKLEGDLNILAWLEGGTVETLKPGDGLRLEARKSEDGNPYIIFVKTG